MAEYARYLTGPLGKQTRPKVIEFDHLTAIQGQHSVLQNITLDIFEGETVALLGKAGSGKSTLLACIQGLVQPTQGRLLVLGASPASMPIELRHQIGIMPQHLNLTATETVATYLQRFAALSGTPLNQQQVQNYCVHYQLPPSIKVAWLTQLQKRILALALALVHDPRLVLLDEPLAEVSEEDRPALLTYLQRTQSEGRTLLCTFTPPVADSSINGYDLVVTLEQGHLLLQET